MREILPDREFLIELGITTVPLGVGRFKGVYLTGIGFYFADYTKNHNVLPGRTWQPRIMFGQIQTCLTTCKSPEAASTICFIGPCIASYASPDSVGDLSFHHIPEKNLISPSVGRVPFPREYAPFSFLSSDARNGEIVPVMYKLSPNRNAAPSPSRSLRQSATQCPEHVCCPCMDMAA